MGVDLKNQLPSSTFLHVTLRQLSWGLEPSPKAPATSNIFGCLSCHLFHSLYHPLQFVSSSALGSIHPNTGIS